MIDWKDFSKSLLDGLKELAKKEFADFQKEALAAGQNYLDQSKSDVQEWALAVASGQMSKEDLEFLVKSKLDVAKLTALKEKGLTKVRVDKFKNELGGLIVRTLFGAVKV